MAAKGSLVIYQGALSFTINAFAEFAKSAPRGMKLGTGIQ